MAKGAIAKQKIGQQLALSFGKDYVGESEGKHYIWADDGGERVQIAVSLTCPKIPLGEINLGGAFGDGIDFSAAPALAPAEFKPAEITDEEKQNIADLMARLGL